MSTLIFRLVPVACLALLLPLQGEAPSWWQAGSPPVIDAAALPNNHGPANIGQAKWMVVQALDALHRHAPEVATLIRADLAGTPPDHRDRIVDLSVPAAKPAGWPEQQQAPLLIGQLKALAQPFYNRLNTAAPAWVKSQIELNHGGSAIPGRDYWQAAATPGFVQGGFYPWPLLASDPSNRAIATIGQLKAVMSLRFETMQANDYEDTDGDGYTNREETVAGTNPFDPAIKPDGSSHPNDPNHPDDPTLLIRNGAEDSGAGISYHVAYKGTRAALLEKPGSREFDTGGIHYPLPYCPKYYLKCVTEEAGSYSSDTVNYDNDKQPRSHFADSASGNHTTTVTYRKVDGIYTSDSVESGAVTFSSLRDDDEPIHDVFDFAENPVPYLLQEKLFRMKQGDFKIRSGTESSGASHDANSESTPTDVWNYSGSSSKSVNLSSEYTDLMQLADLDEVLSPQEYEQNAWYTYDTAYWLWSDDHVTVSQQDIKYRLESSVLPPGIDPKTRVVFLWKEVFVSQDMKERTVTWRTAPGTPADGGIYATEVQTLIHPNRPGRISVSPPEATLTGPWSLQALNPGEPEWIEYTSTAANGQPEVRKIIARSEPVRFRVGLDEQKSNPMLTASGEGTVVLWEQQTGDSWVCHSLPFQIPAAQAAGPASTPGNFLLQGTQPGDVTLQVTVGDKPKYPALTMHVTRLDLDVDSDNTSTVDASNAEEKIEEDATQPGKILVVQPATDLDSSGIPTTTAHLYELKLATANLADSPHLQFDYYASDPARTQTSTDSNGNTSVSNAPGLLRLWKTAPNQIPTLQDYIQPGVSYSWSDLGITRGTTQSFSIQVVDSQDRPTSIRVTTSSAGTSYSDDLVLVRPVCAAIAVDANRDGSISFDAQDQTTEQKPFRFWINNDQDNVEYDEPILVDKPDYYDRETIATKRDLEDFCRLQVQVGISNQQLRDGDLQIGLMFQNSSEGSPGIHIWNNQSPAGNLDYLEDDAAASSQIALAAFEKFSPDQVTLIPKSYWASRGDSTAHLIFEGTTTGTGKLVVTIHDPYGKRLCDGSGIWMKLLDVRQMYQRARIVNEPGQIPDPWANANPPAQTWKWDPWKWPYSEDPDAAKITAVFVHGWRLKYMDYMNWSDTSYKRLWQQGFKGKFYSFRWPCFSGDNNSIPYGVDEKLEELSASDYLPIFPPGGTTYNASEYRAWLCGPALAGFVNQLPNPGKRSLFAHSMGNVIAGAALKSQMSVQFYAMCNSAMAAMAYNSDPILKIDPTTNNEWDKIFNSLDPDHKTPDTNHDPAIRTDYGLENKFNLTSIPTVFSFGLPNDQCLGKWSLNNLYFKPNAQYLYEDYSILKPFPLVYQATPLSPFRSVTGVPEAMGYVTKSITRTAGSDLRTVGSINGRCQDMSNWGPNANHSGFGKCHSAQWRWNNQSTHLFWEMLIEQLELR